MMQQQPEALSAPALQGIFSCLGSQGAGARALVCKFWAEQQRQAITNGDYSNRGITATNMYRTLLPQLAGFPAMHTLNLSGNQLENAGMRSLIRYLVQNRNGITTLNLSNNNIGESYHGLFGLARNLAKTNLTEIDLSGNQISVGAGGTTYYALVEAVVDLAVNHGRMVRITGIPAFEAQVAQDIQTMQQQVGRGA